MNDNKGPKCLFCRKELIKGIMCPICKKKTISVIVAVILSVILSVVFATAAIVYAIIPADFIPDVIPGAGWSDDVVIILLSFMAWGISISPVIAIPIIVFKKN